MNGHVSRKLRNSDITEYRTFPDNFILTSRRNGVSGDQRLGRTFNEQSKTYPVLKVANPTSNGFTTKYRLDSIPNLKNLPHGRMLPKVRAPPKREDTYDTDFMMPSRVREVLEDEGLKHDVIHDVIGRSEEKYQNVLKTMTGPAFSRQSEKAKSFSPQLQLPPIITTKKPRRHSQPAPSTDSSWLDLTPSLSRDQPTSSTNTLWLGLKQQTSRHQAEKEFLDTPLLSRTIAGSEASISAGEAQMDVDRSKWRASQQVEKLYCGDGFTPPRVVLVSSRVPKCHLLTKVYKDDVIPVVYDFDSSSFKEILENITKKLDMIKKNCKARSIMVLCQGGPGYIYLLRNFVVTPQKLHKSSYRQVVGFWRALAGLVSKLSPESSAIHVLGFDLTGNEQGRQLLHMLQSLVYPNIVRVVVPDENTELGCVTLSQYFNYNRYKIWQSYQKLSSDELDIHKEDFGHFKRNHGIPITRLAR